MYLDTTCLGGYREGETPGPIPNPEAKPLFADNTYPFRIGNVGRCLVGCFLHSQNLYTLTLFFTFNQHSFALIKLTHVLDVHFATFISTTVL